MTFDASVGGTASTSYLTLAAAEAYFLGRLSVEDWDALDDDEKQDALMMATQRLDAEPYAGCVVSTTQRLQWPRTGATDRNGSTLVSTAIPGIVQDATCELALVIAADPSAWGGADAASLRSFSNLRIGNLDMTPRPSGTTDALPMIVRRLLYPVRIGGYQNRVVRA